MNLNGINGLGYYAPAVDAWLKANPGKTTEDWARATGYNELNIPSSIPVAKSGGGIFSKINAKAREIMKDSMHSYTYPDECYRQVYGGGRKLICDKSRATGKTPIKLAPAIKWPSFIRPQPQIVSVTIKPKVKVLPEESDIVPKIIKPEQSQIKPVIKAVQEDGSGVPSTDNSKSTPKVFTTVFPKESTVLPGALVSKGTVVVSNHSSSANQAAIAMSNDSENEYSEIIPDGEVLQAGMGSNTTMVVLSIAALLGGYLFFGSGDKK